MDGATFVEWIAFDSIEPLDPAGVIMNGFLKRKEPEGPKSTNDLLAKARALFSGKKKG